MKPELLNQCATVCHEWMAGGWDANCRYSDSVQEGLPVAIKIHEPLVSACEDSYLFTPVCRTNMILYVIIMCKD